MSIEGLLLDAGVDLDFEDRVVALANVVVGYNKSKFYNGTLFVKCTVPEAIKLESSLIDLFPVGVILSRVGDESAFDFV